ncbi:MAG: hypothetical protein ACK4NA_15725 [Alphaproteobacteria bacterium]
MSRDREPNAEFIAQLEKYGAPQVRLMMAAGELGFNKLAVLKWLKDKDEETQKQIEDDRALNMRIALSAKKAAWIAVYASLFAAFIGLAATVLTFVAWMWPQN